MQGFPSSPISQPTAGWDGFRSGNRGLGVTLPVEYSVFKIQNRGFPTEVISLSFSGGTPYSYTCDINYTHIHYILEDLRTNRNSDGETSWWILYF